MKRVASLYLPEWPIDRLRRAGRIPESTRTRSPRLVDATADSLGRTAAAERARTCSVPNIPEGRPGALWAGEQEHAARRSIRHQGTNDGWRPGARWAKADVQAEIERLPLHQRPPMRELGRRSEAADPPFKDNGPYPGEGRFFLTGRMTGDVVGRACPEQHARVSSESFASHDAVPIVTAQRIDGRDVIAAASPAARARGLEPGVWLTQARATVPGLVVLPADPEGDRAALRRLAIALARRWAPAVAISDADGLFIDLTGVAHLHGGEVNFANRLHCLLNRLGYCSRIGIADTPGAAWAFARHLRQHPIFVCPPGAHVDALAPLPADSLRLDPKHLELLRRLGVDTVDELARLPHAPLARRFGGALVRRLDQATGRAPEPIHPVAPPEDIGVVQHFAEPIATAEVIAHWLNILVPRLCEALSRAGRGARLVELVADRVDCVPQRIMLGLARPSRDPVHLLRLALSRVEEIAPGYGLDALTLHVRRSDPLGPEPLDPVLAGQTEPDLAPLVDVLANRLGTRLSWRVSPVESDVPERSVARVPALDPPASTGRALRVDDVRHLDGRAPDHAWHPRWPRPARLLHRPERVDHVLAELPDQPPKRFTWRGTSHRVVHADGPERIMGEWWLRIAEGKAVRDYFRVEDEEGHRFWLFRRGDGVRAETGDLSWHLHGLFG